MSRRRVIVSGATSGIGRGIAEVLAEAGHVVGVLGRDAKRVERVVQALEETRALVAGAVADVRDRKATFDAVEALTESLGGLDVIVANAGVVERVKFVDTSPDIWDRIMRTNVDGLYHQLSAAVPFFVAQQSGHIIVTSSISGRLPLGGGSAYAASKHAATGLAESLFLELRDDGIKVTTLFPGSVHSENRGGDADWKLHPREVGEQIRSVVETGPNNVVSRIEVRPRRRG